MSVVTRFAPSPTGYLHIGGGRTALFNWLYARHHGGTFRLRIEDTDRERSIPSAIEAIFDGLKWLGLDWDDEVVMQFSRANRHAEAAMEMLKNGKAYFCYCSPEELEAMRAKAKAEGKPLRYDGTWRDRDPKDAPAGIKPVVRLKAPNTGETVVNDLVQGSVTVQNGELDDLVLLRSDGTPTYMLSVVVDDHDMGVTNVIRGDDHLTNTFRQVQIYRAMGWNTPDFAHIPLIHGPDGAKLSKRHGALGIDAYREMGYLPEAMRNYLLRLGWGHGDAEIISTEQAIAWFDLPAVGRAPSRLDFAKLAAVNAHYIKEADSDRLVSLIVPALEKSVGLLGDDAKALLASAMPGLKPRAKTMVELAEMALLYVRPRPFKITDEAQALLSGDNKAVVVDLAGMFRDANDFTPQALEEKVRAYAEEKGLKLGKVAQPLRAALTGGTVSPPIFEFASLIGRAESLARLQDAAV